jgi:DNA-binding CsgD family transcriptional regulator
MFPDKSVLIEQINSAIKRNSCNKNFNGCDHSATKNKRNNAGESSDKIQFYFSENIELVKKLEQRIQTLEEEDDHLLYLVHFLFENFAEWVKDILLLDQDRENGKDHKLNGTEISNRKYRQTENIKKDNPAITRREMDVLNLLIKGLCAKEIAHTLFISETTVITHKKHLKEKFNARNSVELISKALLIFR